MLDRAADQNEERKELCTFLVRCWSDPGDDLLVTVRSFSIYQAAQDARFEYPEYDNYDPVCFLQSVLDQGLKAESLASESQRRYSPAVHPRAAEVGRLEEKWKGRHSAAPPE